MISVLEFAAVLPALGAGHWAGDYWLQRHADAVAKGLPGRAGRSACLRHVASYTAAQLTALVIAGAVLAVPLGAAHVAAGLALSAATHYFADRREPLRRLAAAIGKGQFWDQGGAAVLDQAWHWTWVFAAALVIAGRWS
jgi:hypothetical protein